MNAEERREAEQLTARDRRSLAAVYGYELGEKDGAAAVVARVEAVLNEYEAIGHVMPGTTTGSTLLVPTWAVRAALASDVTEEPTP